MRGIEVDIEIARADQRPKNEYRADEDRRRIHGGKGKVKGTVDEGLAAQEDLRGEDHGQAEDHELDLPAHRAGRGAKGSLQVGQHGHANEDVQHMDCLARRGQMDQPVRLRLRACHAAEELAPEQDGNRGKDHENRPGHRSPAGQKLPAVSAREAQAEDKPEAGSKCQRQKAYTLPEDDLQRMNRAGAQTVAQLFQGEKEQTCSHVAMRR